LSRWRTETIGDATLILGDCREVLPTLGRFDAVVTDPPYGVGYADWDEEPGLEWLPEARERFPLLLVTPGIKNLFRWPAPDWVASYSMPCATKRAMGGGLNAWEPILIYGRNPFALDHKQFAPIVSEKTTHPCSKPLLPWTWVCANAAAASGHVLDPFMGSGTTGVACMNLGRAFTGIEIDPGYFDIACRRIEAAYKQPRLFAEPTPKPVQEALL